MGEQTACLEPPRNAGGSRGGIGLGIFEGLGSSTSCGVGSKGTISGGTKSDGAGSVNFRVNVGEGSVQGGHPYPRARGGQVAFIAPRLNGPQQGQGQGWLGMGSLFGGGNRGGDGGGYYNGGKGWHIDGLPSGNFAMFSLLIGVALSDQTVEGCGNLGVFPGSHFELQPYIQRFAAFCEQRQLAGGGGIKKKARMRGVYKHKSA